MRIRDEYLDYLDMDIPANNALWCDSMGNRFVKVPLRIRFDQYFQAGDADQCWGWSGGLDAQGYGQIQSEPPNSRPLKVHRLAYQWAHPHQRLDGWDIHHTCRNRACVNPDHLERRERGAHMAEHARRGHRNPASKLKEMDVRAIKQRLSRGDSQTAIAHEYGVSQAAVYHISTGRNWGWVN